MKFNIRATLVIPFALALSSCAVTRISQITADPLRYRDKTIHVEGVVTASAGAFGVGGYQLSDGTGKILVVSTRGVPREGSHVALTGNVVNGVTVGTKSFGTTISEHERKVKN